MYTFNLKAVDVQVRTIPWIYSGLQLYTYYHRHMIQSWSLICTGSKDQFCIFLWNKSDYLMVVLTVRNDMESDFFVIRQPWKDICQKGLKSWFIFASCKWTSSIMIPMVGVLDTEAGLCYELASWPALLLVSLVLLKWLDYRMDLFFQILLPLHVFGTIIFGITIRRNCLYRRYCKGLVSWFVGFYLLLSLNVAPSICCHFTAAILCPFE